MGFLVNADENPIIKRRVLVIRIYNDSDPVMVLIPLDYNINMASP
jgi:hypothetical protein